MNKIMRFKMAAPPAPSSSPGSSRTRYGNFESSASSRRGCGNPQRRGRRGAYRSKVVRFKMPIGGMSEERAWLEGLVLHIQDPAGSHPPHGSGVRLWRTLEPQHHSGAASRGSSGPPAIAPAPRGDGDGLEIL